MMFRNKKENDVHQGKWNGIGGKCFVGESPDSCVNREFQEETGLTLVTPKMRATLTFPGFRKEEDWVVFLYTATQFIGTLIDDCNEGDLKWVPSDEVIGLPMWEGDAHFLKKLETEPYFTGTIIYQNKKLVSVAFN